MRKIILLLSLVFLMSLSSATILSYNFTNQTNMNATASDGINNDPELGGSEPSGGTITDITGNNDLDSSNDIYVSSGGLGGSTWGFQRFRRALIDMNVLLSDIVLLNWTWEGGAAAGDRVNISIFNWSSNSWKFCGTTTSTTDVNISCAVTDITNYINSTNNFTNVLISAKGTDLIYTDFIKLEVTYLGNVNTSLISPNNATEINSLSQSFVCNYTSSSNRALVNGTLQVWNSTNSLILTNSTNITGTTNSTNLSVTFSLDGTYYWNCLGYNIDNNFDYDINRTIIIDTDPPSPNITSIETTIGSQTVKFNHTATDPDNNLDTSSTGCRYYVTNSSNGIDVANTSVSCNVNNTQFTVSAFGSYNLTLVAFDTAGNQNSTTSNFTVSDNPPGAGDAGGGGGTTTIIQTIIITNWTFVTDTRTDRFDFVMGSGSSRERKLIFTNLEATQTIIKVKCEDVTGDICKYIKFIDVNTTDELTQQNFLFQQTLAASTNVEQFVTFVLELPDDVKDGTYDFNIVGVDQNAGENKVSVRVRVGGLGVLGIIIDKLLGKTEFNLEFISDSDNLKDIQVPNIVLIVLIIIFFSIIPLLLLGSYKFKIYIIILTPIILTILTFIFILE